MTPRQRILAALDHRESDRIPIDMGSSLVTSITSAAYVPLREHLGSLAPRDRLALQLFYEGGRSYREVADALDLPVERIGTLLARARRRLGEALDGLIE